MSQSTLSPSSLEDGKHQASEDKTYQAEPANGRHVESNDEDDGAATEEKAVDEPPAPAPAPPMAYPKGIEVLFIMLALILSITLISLDQTIVATAIPKITDEFKRLDDISWYGSAYFLTLGAFQSMWGKVYKYYPLKMSFLVAIFIFELGSLICGVAQNSMTLIVGRAISGLGASGIAPGVYTISAFSAEPTKRATYTGVIGASYGIAAVAGPLIGGGLTNASSWRWCFYINLPIGGLAAFVIFLTFKNPPAAKVVQATFKEKLLHMDFAGTTLVMGASLALLLALQYAGVSHAWNSSVVIEIWQGERAMLTPRLMLSTTVATFGSGKAITKTGVAAPYLVVSSAIVTIAAGLLYTLGVGSSTGHWVGYQMLAGFGYGLALQVPVIISQAFSEPADIAPTTAIIIFARSLGGTFLLAAAQSAFVNQLVHKLTVTAPGVSPDLVTNTGATELHHVFSGAERDGVIEAYAWGIKVAFATTIAACGITFPFSLLTKWENVNAKKEPAKGSA
ncbi:hypothetical protein ACET3X_002053 [Alternaria dauci]|uniref:Major facilitator superfamily (MFS) profile domain-containing protein n=1 Tax=Alternaria dauci TaxID=48095 RepID=A0ABR3V116_9PLEO